MIYYLSGSLTNGGTKKIDPRHFNEVEKKLKKYGYKVFNPASLEQKEKKSWEWYLARDIEWIHKHRPIMIMLKGWQVSRGAKLELEFANRINLDVVYEVDDTINKIPLHKKQ